MYAALQQEIHGPEMAVRCNPDFTWTMAKLKLQINESLDNSNSKLAHCNELGKK